MPDVDYANIGGLQHQLEQVRDAVEPPFLHPTRFPNISSARRKGVALWTAGLRKNLDRQSRGEFDRQKLGISPGKKYGVISCM